MSETMLSMLPHPLTKTERLTDPFVVAGDRAYLIGQQDGSFPRMGEHVPGEMGGLWAHPHKLLDGFWCALAPVASTQTSEATSRVWLLPATLFESMPWGVRQWFELPDLGLRLCRTLVVPDGRPALLVNLAIEELDGRARDLDLTFLVHGHLCPGWLDTRADGADTASVTDDGATVVATDSTGPWWVAWGGVDRPCATRIGDVDGPHAASAAGVRATQQFRLTVPARGRAVLCLGVHGSTAGAADAVAALHDLLGHADEVARAKQERLAAALSFSRLDVPESSLARAWGWTRCAYDWLVRDVPDVGRGLGAGLPEFPWWFSCDSAYALRGLLPLGDFDLASRTLHLLAAVSERHNPGTGRIIHELSCTGHVFNRGNTQETPQLACAVLETYLWSGDRALLEDLYPLCRQGVLSWTLGARDADGDLLPEGCGITEVLGLEGELIDSAVWTHEGLRAVGRMATLLGDTATADRCAALAPHVRAAIEGRFWLRDDNLYADWIDTPAAARQRLEEMRADIRSRPATAGTARLATYMDSLLERAIALPEDQDIAWPLRYWVIAAPLEAGLTSRAPADRVFARLEGDEFSGPDGVYLSAIDGDKTMSISTGALAAAECAYGRVDHALRYARLLADRLTVRMPGAVSEYLPAAGCFVQAWSGYGIVYPLACGVFGLYPDAAARHLVLCPYLPAAWPHARLRNVRVGEARLDIDLERGRGTREASVTCHLRVDRPNWRATVVPPGAHCTGLLPPLTSLTIHAALEGKNWGIAPDVLAAGQTLGLPPNDRVSLPLYG